MKTSVAVIVKYFTYIKFWTADLYLKAVTKLFLSNNQWDTVIFRARGSPPVPKALSLMKPKVDNLCLTTKNLSQLK